MLKRERGSLISLGSSQARAFTATTVPGGKDTRPALPREFFQAADTLFKEALTPLAHDLAGSIEALSDLVVAQPLGGIQHDLGADHISIR
jgi:hypothetical protein